MATGTGNTGLRLLLDEQISGKVADRLAEAGHDAIAVTAEPMLRGTSDEDLFEIAQSQERVFVTYDRSDFEEILRHLAAYGKEHHGIVFVQQHRHPSREITLLAKALAALKPPKGGNFVIWL